MASFVPIATTLLVRERAGLVVYAGPPSITPDGGTLPSVSPIEVPTITGASVRLPPLYSPDGQYLALVKETITLHSPTGELVSEILCSDASSIEFSPRSSFLLTWSKPTSAGTAAGSAPEGNLKVWETASGRLLTSFFQKSFKRDAVQFTSDERFYCRAVNNEVHILNAADFTAGILTKVYHKGVTQFKISPVAAPDSATSSSSSYVVVVFNAEAGGNPARATLYKFSPERMTVDGPVSSRTMFSASEAVMHFNSSGTAVLVHTQCDVDHSNSSYYGASGLFLMTADGNISAPVSQSKEGPIHDVKWGPAGVDRFVVAAGTMPCHTTLYNAKGESLYQFGAAHRNTISWSPHGRFLALAGFGNLAGDMDFFDILRLRKMGSNNAHCSVTHGWSPCSRYFMTATLAPRMNVDNGFKIFKYNGEGPVANVRIEQAFDAVWQPAAAGVYPARGPSPNRKDGNDDGQAQTASSSSSGAKTAKAAPAASPAAKPYRPPGSSGSLADMMRRGDDAASAAGKVKPAGSGTGQGAKTTAPYAAGGARARVIPGMAPPGAAPPAGAKAKAAADPAAKAAAAAAKKAATEAAERKRKEDADAAAAAAAAAASSKVPTVLSAAEVAALSSEEKEKRCKAVRKKLKQIEEIKEKQRAAATVPLNADQLGKLEAEPELLRELTLLSK